MATGYNSSWQVSLVRNGYRHVTAPILQSLILEAVDSTRLSSILHVCLRNLSTSSMNGTEYPAPLTFVTVTIIVQKSSARGLRGWSLWKYAVSPPGIWNTGLGPCTERSQTVFLQKKVVREVTSSGRTQTGHSSTNWEFRPFTVNMSSIVVCWQVNIHEGSSHEPQCTKRTSAPNRRHFRLSKARYYFPAFEVRMFIHLPGEVRLLEPAQCRMQSSQGVAEKQCQELFRVFLPTTSLNTCF